MPVCKDIFLNRLSKRYLAIFASDQGSVHYDPKLDLGDVCYDGWTMVQMGSNPLFMDFILDHLNVSNKLQL